MVAGSPSQYEHSMLHDITYMMFLKHISTILYLINNGLHCHPDGSDDATMFITMSSTKIKKRIYTNGL